jgi:Flp pilus assembly secretin CpaC
MTTLVKTSGRRALLRAVLAACILAAATAATKAASESVVVLLDQAKLVKLPDRVSTIVVGNPLIADVSLQAGGVMVVTGKGYGVTNLIALDRSGATLMEQKIRVQGPQDTVVTLYRGIQRESYSCTPKCEPRITIGDTQPYFGQTLSQTGTWVGQAQGAAQQR